MVTDGVVVFGVYQYPLFLLPGNGIVIGVAEGVKERNCFLFA